MNEPKFLSSPQQIEQKWIKARKVVFFCRQSIYLPNPSSLVQSKTQTALSMIWTLITVYISFPTVIAVTSLKCLNIHGAHVTANNSTDNNVVFFFCFRFENSIL